jgi:hypothetical protein
MVMGHLVHRFEGGEIQHKELILSYARHERQLQVYRTIYSLTIAHAKSIRRLSRGRIRRAEVQC